MSVYKKEINSLDSAKDVEYVMSNNKGIYINQTVIGENISPYHGLFIKQMDNTSEIYLSKMIESIKINGDTYNICDIETNEEKYGGVEYLEEFNRYPVPYFKYSLTENVKMEKKYLLSEDNVLCISYNIINNNKNSINVKILPVTNKRELFKTKRESLLKLNSYPEKDGCKVVLSITKKEYLYIKNEKAKFAHKPQYINGIKTNYMMGRDDIKTYIEDAYIPGYFEFNVKGKSEFATNIYVSLKDIDLSSEEYNEENLYINQIEKDKMITLGIEESYHELRQLAISAGELNYIDSDNKKFVLLSSVPNTYNRADYLKQTIKSIEGNYIILRKYKEAYRILDSIKYIIEKYKEEYTKLEYYEILFMYIEALSKYVNNVKCIEKERQDIYLYIEGKIIEILGLDNQNKIFDDNYVITIDDKQYLRVNVYWYNVLKIYLDLSHEEDDLTFKIYKIEKNLKQKLIEIFYSNDDKVLKYEASEKPYANADMLLAMDLSYPLIHEAIAMKVIDTAFKELYTPYGIRRFSVNSGKYDGYVYPHIMASFVNSNLRQNGTTRASQKIAYNLVKELFAEINKGVVGTVKYKYDEKTKKAYGFPIDALTNAELIRLYSMLV